MASRRFLTLLGFAAAMLLIAPGGAAAADPGTGQANGQPKHHGTGHSRGPHSNHGHHGHGSGTGSGADNRLDPAVRIPGRTTERDGHVTLRHRDSGQHKSQHWTRRELAGHPGKALGLFKHSDTPVGEDDPGQHGRTSDPPVPATPVSQPGPTNQPPGRDVPRPTDPSNNQPSGDPGTQPPTAQPPISGQEHSLSRLLPRSAQLRFTALPLLIAVALAMCIGGLIGLARHRA
jgi:hypothetical protein